MEHLAETMTDFFLRHKYITEEQTEWCHYIYIECGDCQRAGLTSPNLAPINRGTAPALVRASWIERNDSASMPSARTLSSIPGCGSDVKPRFPA